MALYQLLIEVNAPSVPEAWELATGRRFTFAPGVEDYESVRSIRIFQGQNETSFYLSLDGEADNERSTES